MSKQAMNYLLGQLETLGCLERRVDPSDSRSRRVYLTSRGEAIVTVIRDTVHDIDAAWTAQLGNDDMQQLRELLIRLNTIALKRESRAPEGRLPHNGGCPGRCRSWAAVVSV
jgi:DNA-binding MarR family transcriptional regulator